MKFEVKISLFYTHGMRKTGLLRTKFSIEAGLQYITVKFEFTSISTDPITILLSLLYIRFLSNW